MYKNSVVKAIGETPLIKLENIIKKYELTFNLFAKLERSNPSGSVKDRAAYFIIKDALEDKRINKDSIIIEATSGNMGISLSMIAASFDLKCIICMPENASKERVMMMKAYGAEVILTKKSEGMAGSVKFAEELGRKYKNSFLAHQFENLSNVKAHYETTSWEILKDLEGKLDVFMAGVGTSGTLIGNAKRFKEVNSSIEIIGIEPKFSPLLNKGISGPHLIQGLGPNFLPKIYEKDLVDRVIDITNEEAYEGSRELAKVEGLLCGISSGAALMGALKLDKEKYKNKNVVIILPDNGERYLSVENLYE